jgi:hypothetical protein
MKPTQLLSKWMVATSTWNLTLASVTGTLIAFTKLQPKRVSFIQRLMSDEILKSTDAQTLLNRTYHPTPLRSLRFCHALGHIGFGFSLWARLFSSSATGSQAFENGPLPRSPAP